MNILRQDTLRLSTLRPDAILNVHIVIDYDNISKTELLHCISESITSSKSMHTYIYGICNSKWFKYLEEIMNSVFINYSNVTLVELNNYNNTNELAEYIDVVSGVKNSTYISMFYTKYVGPTMLGKTDVDYLIDKYGTDKPIELDAVDLVKYCNHKYHMTTYQELINTLSTDVKKLRPKLTLKMLYVDQFEKQVVEQDPIARLVKSNKGILSSYDNIIPTSIDSCSIFTSSATIEHLIKVDTKDKCADNIFIVIDTIDRTSCVNPNNNSYYIPIDGLITAGILNTIFDIILKNIYK